MQIVKELFDFRNAIAHDKPEELEEESQENLKDVLTAPIDFVQTDWERFTTESNAIRAQEDVGRIAMILYEKANLKRDGPLGPFAFGFQSRSASF